MTDHRQGGSTDGRDLLYELHEEQCAHGATLRRLDEANEALRLMVQMHERHERWCGYNREAPGDMILNVALERAREVLGG